MILSAVVVGVASMRDKDNTGGTPPPGPTDGGYKTEAQLKYVLIAEFSPLFFCDPDYYPVGRGDEQEQAMAEFKNIQTQGAIYNAILEHLRWSGKTEFSPPEKLTIYREFKRLRAVRLEVAGSGNYSFGLSEGTEGDGYRVTGLISNTGKLGDYKREKAFLTCPICLSKGTRIRTSQGERAVETIGVGDKVLSVNASGAIVALPVLETSKTAVPPSHKMVRIRLSDGRELLVSPRHPSAEGKALGTYRGGEWLDGADIISISDVNYDMGFTYDILTETGLYFANGVLISSTLTR